MSENKKKKEPVDEGEILKKRLKAKYEKENEEERKGWSDLSIEEKVELLGQENDTVTEELGHIKDAIKELYERIEKIEK